jgi:hypothetical protein
MDTNATTFTWQCDYPVLVHDWSISTPAGTFGAIKYSSSPWYLRMGVPKLIPAAPVLCVLAVLAITLAMILLFRRRHHAA